MKITSVIESVRFGAASDLKTDKNGNQFTRATLSLAGWSEPVFLNYVTREHAALLIPEAIIELTPSVNEYQGTTSVQFQLANVAMQSNDNPFAAERDASTKTVTVND